MLTDTNSLRCEIDEIGDRDGKPSDHSQQEGSKPGEGIAATSEEAHISPGIELVLNRKQADFGEQAALAQLGTIGVPLPTHAAKQRPIAQPEAD